MAVGYRRSLRSSECRIDLMSPHTVNGGLRKRSKVAGARTRSMSGGQLYLPSGLLGTTAEDLGNPARTVQNIQNSTAPGKKRVGNERASSADEIRFLLPKPEINGGRRRRVLSKRRSQLAVLSDEAQNFMFREPLGHSSSEDERDEDDDDEDSPSSRVSVKLEVDSNSVDSHGVQRKKRRSQAEAFIEDNREYYKFETTSSRLRFHDKDGEIGHKDNVFSAMNCSEKESAVTDCDVNKDLCKRECVVKREVCNKDCFLKREGCTLRRSRDNTVDEEVKNAVEVKSEPVNGPKYHFSFERVPRSEPWYQTFRRQDLGEEFYYSLPSSADEPFLLPYQLPPPRLQHSFPSGRGRRRGRFGQLLERKPRKSPRCHASTLAILSGFIQRRRRDSCRGRDVDVEVKDVKQAKEEAPTNVVPPTTRSHVNGDLNKLADILDEVLDVSGDDLDMVDVPSNLEQLVPLDKPHPGVRVPVSSLMQEHCECCVRPPPEVPKNLTPKHLEWRTRKRKKRRFNMTGWPDAKKRTKLGPEERLKQLRKKTERACKERALTAFNDANEETNGSSCYTDCDGVSESMDNKVDRLEAMFADESADSDERVLAHFTRVKRKVNDCTDSTSASKDEDSMCEEDESFKGRFSLPDHCVPSTRRLRSAGIPLPRRESPRKVNKTIKSFRESVS